MPNSFAYIALFSWPIVVLWMLIRYPAKIAILLAFTLSTLFLPAGLTIDLLYVPPLSRTTLTSLTLIICLFLVGKKFRIFQSGPLAKILIAYFAVLLISVGVNSTPVWNGGRLLPGLTYYDAFSSIVNTYLWIVPLLLGRFFLSDVKDNEIIFKVLVIVALFYSLFMLFEIRMSPHIHRWVYGYDGSDFIQNMRGDGFRPTVFVGGGLSLAFWFSTFVIAAIALLKNKLRITKVSPLFIVIYFLIVLFLCKTWSAMIYTLGAFLLIFKLTPRRQVNWSLLVAALVLIYPVSKLIGVFPEKEIIAIVEDYNVQRAASQSFRFRNEEILLTHAMEHPYFGWGGWGRNRVYDAYGNDSVVTDGQWIIVMGTKGTFGFILYYLILLTPLYYASKEIKYLKEPKDQVYFATLAIILASGIADSIPNSSMGSLHLLLAGALLGQSELLKKRRYLIVDDKAKQNHS